MISRLVANQDGKIPSTYLIFDCQSLYGVRGNLSSIESNIV